MLSGHVAALAAKEAVLEPPPRRDDLVYVHCATTEDEAAAEDEEEEPRGLTRSRSWLCCPSDRRADKTVPIQVEIDNKDKQNAVSLKKESEKNNGRQNKRAIIQKRKLVMQTPHSRVVSSREGKKKNLEHEFF